MQHVGRRIHHHSDLFSSHCSNPLTATHTHTHTAFLVIHQPGRCVFCCLVSIQHDREYPIWPELLSPFSPCPITACWLRTPTSRWWVMATSGGGTSTPGLEKFKILTHYFCYFLCYLAWFWSLLLHTYMYIIIIIVDWDWHVFLICLKLKRRDTWHHSWLRCIGVSLHICNKINTYNVINNNRNQILEKLDFFPQHWAKLYTALLHRQSPDVLVKAVLMYKLSKVTVKISLKTTRSDLQFLPLSLKMMEDADQVLV